MKGVKRVEEAVHPGHIPCSTHESRVRFLGTTQNFFPFKDHGKFFPASEYGET